MTQAWIDRQIRTLSVERDKARDRVNSAKAEFEVMQKMTDEAHERLTAAFETLDRLDDCVAGLKEEYDGMSVLESEAENQAAELAGEMLPEGVCGRK